MKAQQIEAKIAELTAQAKALQNQIDHFELDSDDYAEHDLYWDRLGESVRYMIDRNHK